MSKSLNVKEEIIMKEIRIGLVGSGWMGKAHSSALADAEMLFGPDYGTASFEIVADANERGCKVRTEEDRLQAHLHRLARCSYRPERRPG